MQLRFYPPKEALRIQSCLENHFLDARNYVTTRNHSCKEDISLENSSAPTTTNRYQHHIIIVIIIIIERAERARLRVDNAKSVICMYGW